MSDEQATNATNDSENPKIGNPSVSEYVPEVEPEQKSSTTQCEPCTYKNHPPVKIEFIPHDTKGKKSTGYFANVIQIVALSFNILMLVATFYLFLQTKESVRIAHVALDSSASQQRQSRIDKANDDLIARDERVKSDIRADSALKLSHSSLDAQIKSIQDVNKRFKVENQPLLQVSLSKSKIPHLTKDKPFGFVFQIENLGKYPVRLKSGYHGLVFRYIPPGINSIRKDSKGISTESPLYITKESPVSLFADRYLPVLPETVEKVEQNKLFLFFYGKVTYEDLSSGDIREYSFLIKLIENKGVSESEWLINDNKTISVHKE